MALLLDIRDPDWLREQELKVFLQPLLPGVEIFCGVAAAKLADVIMLAANRLYPGVAASLPNLRLLQKLGAGVDGMADAAELAAAVRVTRMRADEAAMEIAEYCMTYVLQARRNVTFHQRNQVAKKWHQRGPLNARETTVGVLGLGHIGGFTASSFARLGYRVIGWSRSEKSIAAVDCRFGDAALPALLRQCDFVVCILPSTRLTRNLFDKNLFAAIKPGAMIINAGRGDLIVDNDLLQALDSGNVGAAVLDVFDIEPLPAAHRYWRHPKVTITPHVSGWHVDSGLDDIAENYRRLIAEQPLINEINRSDGY